MRGLLVFVMSALLFVSGPASAGWDVVGTTKGVKVERTTMADSALFAFRGKGTFDVPIGLLVTVLKDEKLAVEWVDLMLEHSVVRTIDEGSNLIYESYGLPWPISDRDYLMIERYTYDGTTKVFTIDYESVTDPAKPVSSKFVRAVAYRTFWRLEQVGPGRTKVEVEVFTDPKGVLPSWLINLIQEDWPWKTIDGLVRRAQKGDIKVDPGTEGW
jgi:hypothetical protein|tara:strand:+ start:60 stop:701 length:642 start_codon:yes stop_codon:yes gene_type:complete